MAVAVMRALWLAKSTSAEKEWEDGFAFDEALGLAAVADGASSAAHSADWARQLTTSYVDRPFEVHETTSFSAWLSECQGAWAPPPAAGDNWWSEAVTTQGSWATFAALRAFSTGPGWKVVLGAVGDTCWFHLRDGALIEVFPPMTSADFGTHPELVGTAEASRARTVAAYETKTLSCAVGDVVVGATDALAEWALATGRDHPGVWTLLQRIDAAGLRRLACDERAARRMVDDDVTLLRCRLGATA